jgi:hypothetical protein
MPPAYLPPRSERVVARRTMLAFSDRRQRSGSGSDLGHLSGRATHVPGWANGAIRALRRAGIRFGVTGGLAANNYMPPRNTDDFDLALCLADLVVAGEAATAAGWEYLGPLALYGGLAGTAWKDAADNELDLIGVPGALGREAVAEAQDNLITAGLPTVTLPFLVVLKLIAARPQDTADLSRMLGRADAAVLGRTRAVVGRFLPDELPELEQFIALGRLEYAPPDPRTPGGTPPRTDQQARGEVRCRICGRVLKDEAARRAGIGADCARNERLGLTRRVGRGAPRRQ